MLGGVCCVLWAVGHWASKTHECGVGEIILYDSHFSYLIFCRHGTVSEASLGSTGKVCNNRLLLHHLPLFR